MERVKVSKEVAEAMTALVIYYGDTPETNDIFGDIVGIRSYSQCSPEAKVIHENFKDNWLNLAKCLINGYEVEQTPEDKVAELFNRPNIFHAEFENTFTAFRHGIRETLNAYNIKIEGVNA